MISIDCHNCLTEIEVVKGLTECPACLVDIRRQVAAARQKKVDSTVVPESEAKPESEAEVDLDDAPSDRAASTESTIKGPIADDPSPDTSDNDQDKPEFELVSPPAESNNPTLVVPDSEQEASLRKRPPTIGHSEVTARLSASLARDKFDSAALLEQLSPEATLVVPPPIETPGTIINPAAAQEAAEIYSKGLNQSFRQGRFPARTTQAKFRTTKLKKSWDRVRLASYSVPSRFRWIEALPSRF